MKKFFSIIGFITILCFSFIYAEKTAAVVKEYDDIMIKIKEEADKYKVAKIEAIIEGDYIIPGINGNEVDINESYQRMRKIGVYSEKYLIFKNIKVSNLLINNNDKFIKQGNSNKKMISFIFLVDNDDDIKNVLSIMRKNSITSTFFLDGYWFEKNNDQVYEIVNDMHDIGSTGYNNSYDNSSYIWLDHIIKKIYKRKNSYCLKNNTVEKCIQSNNFVIDPIKINDNYFINVKNNLDSALIYAFNISNNLEKELPLIINYVNSKGYQMVKLSTLLME